MALFTQVTRLVQDGRGPMPQMDFGPIGGELFFRGKPVYRDKDATSGTITFINKNELKTKWLPRRTTPQDAVQQSIEQLQGSSGDSVKRSQPLSPQTAVLRARSGRLGATAAGISALRIEPSSALRTRPSA